MSEKAWKPKVNPWLIAAAVALAAFMEVLDTSIANVALPHIAGNLGASTDESTWVLTSYLVSNAIFLPIGAWASSVFGRKRFFLFCIFVFTVASFLCSISVSLPMLLVSRIIQGAGGGGLQPMAQAIMADSFDEKNRGRAFALYGLVTVLAPSVGPVLGGWITDNYSWRWIFYVNIPVGIFAAVLVTRLVEDPPWIKADRSNLKKLDYIGLGLLTIAMGGMQIMLDKGEDYDWFASNFIRVFGALFAVGMIGLIWWEWRAKNPILNLRLFKFKNFAVCAMLMLILGGLLNTSIVLQPQFSQGLLGYTATVAGEAMTAGGLSLLVLMPAAGFLTGKVAPRYVAAGGFAFFAFGFYYASTHTTLGISFAFNSWMQILKVAPIPFCFVAITNAAYLGLPKEASNQVSGITNFARNVGGSIFISLTGAMVANRALFHQSRLADHMRQASTAFSIRLNALTTAYGNLAGGRGAVEKAGGMIYKQLNQQASAMAYGDVYRLVAWVAVAMVVAAFLLSKKKPDAGAPAAEGMG